MYLSNLKYSDILFKLDSTSLEKLVFCRDGKLVSADIGIVLGGVSMIPDRVNKAFELYKKGIIKKILVSGGIGHFNLKRTITEAQAMKDYLLSLGLLDEDILVEDKSRNTYENFLYSYHLLKEKMDLKGISFTLITSDFHMKRAKELFKYFFKDSKFITCSVMDGKTDKDMWKKSFKGRYTIRLEGLLLRSLFKKKLIDDIKIS
ncbi:MAG: YdcF family protein [bacterium]|nr:YdcF family protein [bacterium]